MKRTMAMVVGLAALGGCTNTDFQVHTPMPVVIETDGDPELVRAAVEAVEFLERESGMELVALYEGVVGGVGECDEVRIRFGETETVRKRYHPDMKRLYGYTFPHELKDQGCTWIELRVDPELAKGRTMQTIAHELGHAFGLDHADGSFMESDVPTELHMNAEQRAYFRSGLDGHTVSFKD